MSSAQSPEEHDRAAGEAPEDRPGEVGAEGGSDTARRSKLPPMPDEQDDSPLGDTDQHSKG
jgi:hypothetical protein